MPKNRFKQKDLQKGNEANKRIWKGNIKRAISEDRKSRRKKGRRVEIERSEKKKSKPQSLGCQNKNTRFMLKFK